MPIQNAFVKFTYIPRAQYTALTKDANTYYAVVETDGKLRYYLGSAEFSYLPLTGGTLTDDLMMAFADGADPRPSKNILFQGRIGGTPYTKALNMGADGILKFNGTAISLDGHTHGSYNRATSALTGANVFSDIVVSNGIVTSISTRALTVSDIGAAAASHSHGSIANDGTIAVTAVTPTSTDYILISDTSDSSRISRGILIGSSTTTYLRNDGTWGTPAGTYSLPLAANGTRGGIQIGYVENGTNYAVQLSSEKAFVAVPWTDTKNTAGSTDISTKIFLIGASSQAANPQTYSDDEVFVTDGVLSAKRLTLTVADGTAPMTITSTTVVTNLNADKLDGQHGSYYAAASSLASYLPLTGGTLTGNLTLDHATIVGTEANSLSIIFTSHSSSDITKALYTNPSGILLFDGNAIYHAGNNNIGTGATNFAAGNHTHSTYDRASSVLSGANVFSDIVVTDGIVTAISTRALTAADIGAAASSHTHSYLPLAGGTLTDDLTMQKDGSTEVGSHGIVFQHNSTLSGGDATKELNVDKDGVLKFNGNTVWHSGNLDPTDYLLLMGDQTIAGTKTFSSTISGSINGNAGTATTLQTGRTIAVGTAVSSTATSFNGSANITIPINSVSEAYLSWGGKSLSSSYAPIDAAMVGELGANRFAFMPAGSTTVQYSTDGGTTWIDYGASDSEKINFLNGIGATFRIGKNSTTGIDYTNYRLRVIIATAGGVGNLYTTLNKFVILVSTNGSSGTWCSIDGRTQQNFIDNIDTWTNFANQTPIGGWSGYNVINTSGITTFGNVTTQYGQLRFTFGGTGYSPTYSGLQVIKLLGFGGVGWQTPSNLAKYGNMYTYDSSQNTLFPAAVQGTRLISTIATGTAPLTVTSTTLVTNLNADLLDGIHAASFARVDLASTFTTIPAFNGGTSGATAPFTVDSTFLVTNLNADLLDGNHASAFAAASHAHGYITVDGLLTSDDTLGNGDKLLFSDSSNGGKITAMNLSIATVHNDTYLRRDGTWATPINTLNTAGATDISTKIYLIGAGAQTANPQTYSDNEVFVESGVLTTKEVQVGGGSATMKYDATSKSLKFVFA